MNKQAWLDKAKEMGFDGLEIYRGRSAERRVSWFGGQMDSFVTSDVLGTSLRAVVNGKAAHLALEKVDDGKIEETLEALRAQADIVSEKEPESLREPAQTEEADNTREWIVPSMELIRETLGKLEAAILAVDPRVKQVTDAGWEEEVAGREITNSLGMKVADEGRTQILYAGCAAEENGEVKNDYHVEAVPDLSKLDIEAFAKKTAEGALSKLGGAPVPSGSYPVIFKREAMTSLFGAFSDMFSGDLIGKGLSPLKDKLNADIFSPKITVVDDPRCPDALRLANYDDEGCPTRRKVLVENGIFRSMLHNTQSAARMGTESTGNGFKHGYAGTAEVSPMNIAILPGEKTLDELTAEMGEGLVIEDLAGLHAGLNHVTADFSLQCAGYSVKGGKRAQSVALITVAGNFLDLLKKVRAVGSDFDWEYRTVACPSILFEECAVAGK